MKNMSNGYKLGLAAIVASISLVGCGSDSTSTVADVESDVATVTGQFVDTYVSGLNYTCSSGTTGVTNNLGEYTCNVGDTVEFSLGGYVLGSAAASSGIVTPEALYPDNPEAALNVAQVIQSLDADPTDDIITIPENFTALDDVDTTPEDVDFDDLIETVLIEAEIVDSLVSEEDAQVHLDETELQLLLAGKTFYNVGDSFLDELVFNADLTSSTWTAIASNDTELSATDVLDLVAEKLYVGNEGMYLVFAEETSDYLLFNIFDTSDTLVEQARLYFDQTKAEAYFATMPNGYVVITEEKLSGKTFYNTDADDQGYGFASMTITSTELTRHEIWYDDNGSERSNETFTLPSELVRGRIRIDVTDFDEGYMWVTLLSEDASVWNVNREIDYAMDGPSGSYTDLEDWFLAKPVDFPDSL